MRTALLRPALLALALGACARASTTASTATPVPAADAADSSFKAEEDARYARASLLRERILTATQWETFDSTQCNPGTLRIYSNDSTATGWASVDSAVAELERIVIGRGIDEPVDTPRGHALLATVMRWEAAAARPRWDVPQGAPPRIAIAAGLSGEFMNPQTKKCETYVPFDTVTFVVPPLAHFTAPAMKGIRTTVFYGDSGLRMGRDRFFAAHGGDPKSIFMYTAIGPIVTWRDFGVIAVRRPAEAAGTVQLSKGAGGAAYLFHRVGEEWRLLAIVRTWG